MDLILLVGNSLLNKEWIEEVETQKTSDPAISFVELKKFLEELGVKNYKVVEIPGKDHHYENVEQLKELVSDFIK